MPSKRLYEKLCHPWSYPQISSLGLTTIVCNKNLQKLRELSINLYFTMTNVFKNDQKPHIRGISINIFGIHIKNRAWSSSLPFPLPLFFTSVKSKMAAKKKSVQVVGGAAAGERGIGGGAPYKKMGVKKILCARGRGGSGGGAPIKKWG